MKLVRLNFSFSLITFSDLLVKEENLFDFIDDNDRLTCLVGEQVGIDTLYSAGIPLSYRH